MYRPVSTTLARSLIASGALLLLLWSADVLATSTTPVQFVDGIWLSNEPVYALDTTRVYVALRNSTNADMTGTVTMYANDTVLGTKAVTALPGRLIETWSDWRPSESGTHTISAVLHDIIIHYPDREEPIAESITIDTPPVAVREPQPEPLPDDPRSGTTTATENSGTTSNTFLSMDPQQGIEQFLPDNQAHAAFDQFSEQISVTADRLRQHEQAIRDRFYSTSTATTSTSSSPEHEATATTTPDGTVWTSVQDFFVRNVQRAYVAIVTVLRWFFEKTILVHILVLLGLLWLTYRTARHFGQR